MEKMNVVRIFKSDNGDVFFEHDNQFKYRSYEEVNELTKNAKNEYKKGNYLECRSEIFEAFDVRQYFYKEEFLGDKGMHIRSKFNTMQNFIFLKNDGKNSIEKLAELAEKEPNNIKNMTI